jgi:hypothetical protein
MKRNFGPGFRTFYFLAEINEMFNTLNEHMNTLKFLPVDMVNMAVDADRYERVNLLTMGQPSSRRNWQLSSAYGQIIQMHNFIDGIVKVHINGVK